VWAPTRLPRWGPRAYGFARVSALKAGLRRPGRVAGRAVPLAPECLPDHDRVFDELLAVYRTVLRGYPELHAVVDALLARHELTNALLALRVMLRHRPADLMSAFWRDLRDLATLPLDRAVDATTPAALADAVARSRLAEVAPLVREARVASLASTSLAAERQIWSAVDRAFVALPRRDASTRALGALLVVEQDLDWLRRAPAAASIDASAAARATFVLARELPPARLSALASWTPERGPIAGCLPLRWTWRRDAQDWDALIVAARDARRRLCERAFTRGPFSLDVPLAVMLLKEEEVNAMATAGEAGAERSPAALRAYAASLFGA
jgi:hypothetical protein